MGGVWFLQGINVLPGSFMTGQTKWAIYGGLLFLTGIALLVQLIGIRHFRRMSSNDVSEVRDELEAIAAALRNDGCASEAGLLSGLNRTFFTTTTEYLIGVLDALDEISVKESQKRFAPQIQRRIDSVAIEARRLANLR